MSDDALITARLKVASLEPAEVAARVAAQWDVSRQELALPFFGSTACVSYPAYEVSVDGRPLPPHMAALVLFHLAESDGSLPRGRWVSFADLPDGSFYVTAFRGYTGATIARRFGSCPEALDAAVRVVGGAVLDGLADRAWLIPALPLVPLALLWWYADEEFEARAEILFDASAPHQLNTEACAILGSWLTSRLCNAEAR